MLARALSSDVRSCCCWMSRPPASTCPVANSCSRRCRPPSEAPPTTILVTHHVEEIPGRPPTRPSCDGGLVVAPAPIADVLTDANVTACFDAADLDHGA